MNIKKIIILYICILVNTNTFSQVCEIDSINYNHIDCYGDSTGSISVKLYSLIVFIRKLIGGLVLMASMQIKH